MATTRVPVAMGFDGLLACPPSSRGKFVEFNVSIKPSRTIWAARASFIDFSCSITPRHSRTIITPPTME